VYNKPRRKRVHWRKHHGSDHNHEKKDISIDAETKLPHKIKIARYINRKIASRLEGFILAELNHNMRAAGSKSTIRGAERFAARFGDKSDSQHKCTDTGFRVPYQEKWEKSPTPKLCFSFQSHCDVKVTSTERFGPERMERQLKRRGK